MHSKIPSIYRLMVMPESYENQETERPRYCINYRIRTVKLLSSTCSSLNTLNMWFIQVNRKIERLIHLHRSPHPPPPPPPLHHHHHHHHHLRGLVRNRINSIFLFLQLEYSFMRNKFTRDVIFLLIFQISQMKNSSKENVECIPKQNYLSLLILF
jgi:hypothetical protein